MYLPISKFKPATTDNNVFENEIKKYKHFSETSEYQDFDARIEI